MKKIPTIFRDSLNIPGQVLTAPNPECQWVFDRVDDNYVGGVLRKYDGLCCMILDGELWKRSVIPQGAQQPPVWRLVQLDDINHTIILWEPVDFSDPEHAMHREAFQRLPTADEGTYELIGPGIKGNYERVDSVRLMRHDHAASTLLISRSFLHIRYVLQTRDVYGYVFTHPDGRKAKINRTHFGLDRSRSGFHECSD